MPSYFSALQNERFKTGLVVTLTALLILPAGCASIRPAAGQRETDDGLNHQPTSFRQMEKLVTTDDPAVTQALQEILNPAATPQPVATTLSGMPATFTPASDQISDFDLILEWVYSHCVYTTDQDSHGVFDYWQAPAETIKLGTGDCEDHAILMCSLLRAYGVPADRVYVAVGFDLEQAHAWLVERYETGIWRVHDSNAGTSTQALAIGSSTAGNFKTDYCFNDRHGFYGNPALPAGVYEFESSVTSYPIGTGAGDNYYRYLNAGQRVSATVAWLPYDIQWPFNPNVLDDWSFNVYDASGQQIFSWSGTDTQKSLDFSVLLTGSYRIEVVKRDNAARPARLTMDPPEGWTTEKPLRIELLRVKQVPLPTAGGPSAATTPADANPPAASSQPVPAPIVLPQDELKQQALALINEQHAARGDSPAALGTNDAAQQQADDMMAHDFVSDWGTDGSTPVERYTLAGGTAAVSENERKVAINWTSDPAGFAGALQTALKRAITEMYATQDTYTIQTVEGTYHVSGADILSYELSHSYEQTGVENYQLQPSRIDIGIAYNGESLYLVLQYENFYVNLNQLPNIEDEVLSLAGECAPGMNIASVSVYYLRPPAPLTPSQISYDPNSNTAQRMLVEFFYMSYGSTAFLSSRGFLELPDPHIIPLYFPAQAVTGLTLKNSQGSSPVLGALTTDYKDFLGFNLQGNSFSFSANLDPLVGQFGKGVYVISVSGKSLQTNGSTYTYVPLLTYAIFLQ